MVALVKENAPILIVIASLFSAYLLPVFMQYRRYGIVGFLALATQFFVLFGGIFLATQVLAKGSFRYILAGWEAPWGLEITIDPLSTLFLIMIGLINLLILVYALPSLADELGNKVRATWFLTLFMLLTAALCGMALCHDLFNLYVFIEVATISGCAIVGAKGDARSTEATFKYLILATLGSCFVLGGIGFLYNLTGNLNMLFVNHELAQTWSNYQYALWVSLSFFIVGFGIKSAVFPLHVWLPDAHSSAITPASAVLSAISVKGYVLGLVKVFYIAVGPLIVASLNISDILLLLGMGSIIAGSIFAIAQTELKRRFAFSTIAQIGYIFLGLGLNNQAGLTGAFFHIFSHALIKTALFLIAGFILIKTGKSQIKDLTGIGKQMPLTMGAFTVVSLGMTGIPLFSGFIGKWNLLLGSLEAGNWLAILVLLAGSILAAIYLFPIIKQAYFTTNQDYAKLKENTIMIVPILILAGTILLLGIFPRPVLTLASQAASMLLGQ